MNLIQDLRHGAYPASRASLLSCMAFNCVYEARVACQSRSSFVLYSPLKISPRLFRRKDDNIPADIRKYNVFLESSRYLEIYRSDEANGNTNKISVQITTFLNINFTTFNAHPVEV